MKKPLLYSLALAAAVATLSLPAGAAGTNDWKAYAGSNCKNATPDTANRVRSLSGGIQNISTQGVNINCPNVIRDRDDLQTDGLGTLASAEIHGLYSGSASNPLTCTFWSRGPAGQVVDSSTISVSTAGIFSRTFPRITMSTSLGYYHITCFLTRGAIIHFWDVPEADPTDNESEF